jgi:hypothetical protein
MRRIASLIMKDSESMRASEALRASTPFTRVGRSCLCVRACFYGIVAIVKVRDTQTSESIVLRPAEVVGNSGGGLKHGGGLKQLRQIDRSPQKCAA